MLNLLKMDFYRLFRSKCLWIITLIYIVLVVAATGSMCNERKECMKDPQNYTTYMGTEDGYEEVLAIESDDPIFDLDKKMDILYTYGTNIRSFATIFFFMIFTILFVAGENTTGFIKNIVSTKGVRTKRMFSNMIVIFVALCLIVCAAYIASAICTLVALGSFGIGTFGISLSSIFIFNMTWLVAALALCMIAYLIHIAIGNAAVSMALSISISIGLASYITKAIESLLKLSDQPLTQHLLTTQMSTISDTVGPEYVTMLIVAGCYFVFALVTGTILMRNKDIR